MVPSYRLFPSATPIAGSPFAVSPSGRKPTPVQNVSLAVTAWNALQVRPLLSPPLVHVHIKSNMLTFTSAMVLHYVGVVRGAD